MSNYYYFASDEEYQYALEHGWIKDTAKKVKGFVKTTASKITLNKKRKQIEKTPVKAGSDLSEAKKDKTARVSARKTQKIAEEHEAAEEAKASKEASYKSRNEYARRANYLNQQLEANKMRSRIRGEHRGKYQSTWYVAETDDELNQDIEADNAKSKRADQRNVNKNSRESASSNSAKKYVAKYRSEHPKTKLSDYQIARNGGYYTGGGY